MSISDFQIIKQIGKGAFGLVYLVKRKKDNNIYALKSVQISKLTDKEKYNSLNEVRILASINHSNIISYKECFYDTKNESLNLIMEYADDGDLQSKIQSLLKANMSFKEEEIWSIFIQMVQGLKALHDSNILHRDLKSANIFLMKNGLCKLGDMNVSKVVKLGLLYTQTGTPYYASPEVWSDKPYNFKSDIWSIGCILYELCCLRLPFKGKNFDEVYKNVMIGKYQPIPPHYSKDLSTVISMLLQVNPAKRPNCDVILSQPFILQRIDTGVLSNLDQEQKIMAGVENKLLESIRFHSVNDLNQVLPKKTNYNNNNNNHVIRKPPVKSKTIDRSDSSALMRVLSNQNQNHQLLRSNSQVSKPKSMMNNNNSSSSRHIRSDTQSNENIKRPRAILDSNIKSNANVNAINGKYNMYSKVNEFTSPNKEQNHNYSIQSTNPNTKCSNMKSIQTSSRKVQHEEIKKMLKYQAIPKPLGIAGCSNINKANYNYNTNCTNDTNDNIPEELSVQLSNSKRERPQSCGYRKKEIAHQQQQQQQQLQQQHIDPSKKILINPIKIVESHNLRNLLPSHMQIKLNSLLVFTNKPLLSDACRLVKQTNKNNNSNCINTNS